MKIVFDKRNYLCRPKPDGYAADNYGWGGYHKGLVVVVTHPAYEDPYTGEPSADWFWADGGRGPGSAIVHRSELVEDLGPVPRPPSPRQLAFLRAARKGAWYSDLVQAVRKGNHGSVDGMAMLSTYGALLDGPVTPLGTRTSKRGRPYKVGPAARTVDRYFKTKQEALEALSQAAPHARQWIKNTPTRFCLCMGREHAHKLNREVIEWDFTNGAKRTTKKRPRCKNPKIMWRVTISIPRPWKGWMKREKKLWQGYRGGKYVHKQQWWYTITQAGLAVLREHG